MNFSTLENIYNKLKLVDIDNIITNVLKEGEITVISKNEIVSLSVIITACNRTEQTYFSLKSWNNIAKINDIYIQIIIVEDTLNINEKIDTKKLIYSNLDITYIYIKNKSWDNPCLNYNIGFKYITSDISVITNSETCIFGNIYKTIKNKLTPNNYLVFDVFNIGNKWQTDDNLNIWKVCNDFKFETVNNFKKNKEIGWLQSQNNNNQLHFLSCINTASLLQINGFDSEFMFGLCWDDNILLSQIKYFLKLEVCSIYHDQCKVVGLHQWHTTCTNLKKSTNYWGSNDILYHLKINYLMRTNKYLYLKDFKTFDDLLETVKT